MNMLRRLILLGGFLLATAMPAAAETVDIGDGVSLAYTKAGSGEQTAILIHGYSFSKEIWSKIMPELARDMTVYAYDLRGFGDSTKTESGYDYATMVADLKGFMDALDIERAALVGHSLGGVFIQDFAAAHPDRVSHLVMLNVQARNKPPLGMNDRFRERIDAWGSAETNAAIFEKATPVYFKKGSLTEAELAELVAMNSKSSTPALKQSFEHFLTAEPMPEADWAKIDMPVLIVASTHDIVPISVAAGLLDSLPQSEVVVIARAGHSPMWEKPEAVAEAIRATIAAD